MGFMDQFRKQEPTQASRLSEVIGLAQGIAGNDPRGLVERLAASGATCNLPNGKVIPVSTLASMAEGKTAQQLLSQLGIS